MMKTTFRFLAAALVASTAWLAVPTSADAACKGTGPNGIWDKNDGEGCDDGNTTPGDGCSATCTVETGYSCGLAIPFDGLNTWAYAGSANDANWSSGFTSRTQTKNTAAPTFAHFGIDAQNIGSSAILELYANQCTYSGNGQNPSATNCNNGGDDDYLGFVLGFNPATANTASGQYILIDWKAISQSWKDGNTTYNSVAGLRLSVVEGIPDLGTGDTYGRRSDFWRKTDIKPSSKVRFVTNAVGAHTNTEQPGQNTYGTTGWKNQVAYQFRFDYTPQRLIVEVREGATGTFTTVFDLTAAAAGLTQFPAGEIGFFGVSQPNARYSLINPVGSVCALIKPVDIVGPSVTALARPAITGEGAPGATVTISFPGYSGTSIVQPDGTWSHTPIQDLPLGDTTVTATQNHAGVPSNDTHVIRRVTNNVTITNPANGAVLGGTEDGYAGIYSVTGTGVPGAAITLTLSGAGAGGAGPYTTTVNASGLWTVAGIPGTGNGAVTLYALSEIAGVADADATSALTLDNATTGTISTPVNGSTIAGPVTTITGSGEPGAVVSLTVNGGTAQTATVTTTGTWSITVPAGSVTNNGSYALVANFTDSLGNTAGPVNSSFTIDACGVTPPPSCTSNSTCVNNSGSGGYTCQCDAGYVQIGTSCVAPSIAITAPATGSTITTSTPTVTGTTVPNTAVTVTIGGTTACTATSNASGDWSCDVTNPSLLPDGSTKTITATANVGGPITANTVVTVNIDNCVGNTCGSNGTCVDGTNTYTCNCNTGFVLVGGTCVTGPTIAITGPTAGTITNDTTPTVTGTSNQFNTPVTITFMDNNGTVISASVTTNNTGAWTFTPDGTAGQLLTVDGPYDIEASITVGGVTATDDTDIVLDTVITGAITGPTGTVAGPVATITGTGEVGATVTGTVDGKSFTATVDNSGNWSATIVGGPLTNNGSYTTSATFTDAAGNSLGPITANFTISACASSPAPDCGAYGTCTDVAGNDTYTCVCAPNTAPNAAGVCAPPYVVISAPADNSTIATQTPTLTGTATPGTTVTLTNGATTLGTATVAADGTWTFTIPDANKLPEGIAQTIVATITVGTATATDDTTVTVAINICTLPGNGNICGANATCVDSTTDLAHTCVCNPGYVPVLPLNAGNGCVSGPMVRIDAPADNAIINTGTPRISGVTNPNTDVTLTLNGKTYGPIPADATGAWHFDVPTADTLEDGGPYTVTANVEVEGVPATDSNSFSVDTDVCGNPAYNTCDPNSTCDDQGNGNYDCICHDGFIKDDAQVCVAVPHVTIVTPVDGSTIRTTKPTLTGTSNPNATIVIELEGVAIGTTTADASGDWTFVVDPADALVGEGPHHFVARNSVNSNPADDATDTTSVFLNDELDTVIIETPTEGATVVPTPTVTGTSNPDATITISIDGVEVGTTTADANGQWTYTVVDPIPHGPANIKATDKDANGGAGTEDDVNVNVDHNYQPVVITGPADGSTVTTAKPPVTGTGHPNTEVTIVVDGKEVGKVPVDGNGNWTWTPAEDLKPGKNTITAKGIGDSEDSIELTVATEPGVPTVITGPKDGSITIDRTPTVTGTAEPNTEVTIVVDGKVVGKAPVDGNGKWTWTPTDDLKLGDHTIIARGDNGSEDSITLTIANEIPTMSGGRLLGCASTEGQFPATIVILAGLSLLALARRRERDAA